MIAALQTKRVRAPLRWAGSKKKLLPLLRRYCDKEPRRYVEAFAGSAALFFDIQPDRALLNDTNEELIFALSFLRDHPRLLHDYVVQLPVEQAFYYRLRSTDIKLLDPCERAGRFFYLNRYCFNGIYRTNKMGQFNVPFAPTRSGRFPCMNDWLHAANLLSRADLRSQDFQGFLIENVERNDFVYLDPPYAVSNRRIFAQYSAENFGVDDLRRLASALHQIHERGARFVVSYAQSPETEILTGDWYVKRTYAQRNIAGFTHHRRRAMEVIISNHAPNLTDS